MEVYDRQLCFIGVMCQGDPHILEARKAKIEDGNWVKPYWMYYRAAPPSIVRQIPLTNEASSEAR